MSNKRQRRVVTTDNKITQKKSVLRLFSGMLAVILVGTGIPVPKTVKAEADGFYATPIPGVTESPIITQIPDITGLPTITGTPETTQTPSITNVPSITNIPKVTEVPRTTVTPTVTITPTVTVAPSASLVNLGRKITFKDIYKRHRVNTKNKAFLVNLTEGSVIAAARSSDLVDLSGLSELMTVLVILNNSNITENVTISKKAANITWNGFKDFGFKEGDTITIGNLLSCYLLTRSDDARFALVEHIAGDESNFVILMNEQVKKLKLRNSNFVASKGAYNVEQYSMIHDIYLIMYQLLQNEWFATNMGKESIKINYITKNKTIVNKICEDESLLKFSKVKNSTNYTTVAQFTSSDKMAKGNQIVIVKDKSNNFYFSLLAQVDTSKDISKESAKLIAVLDGKEYQDEVIPVVTPTPEVTKVPTPTPVSLDIPTKSNDARYQYLLGTNYKAYTISSPPKGYTSAVEAAKQMTTITVPVWKISSAGKKYSTTMNITIHKKLASSTAKIFKEIFALDIKFPIKTLVGFNYRKVGGVGLRSSTLMSIHAFGAAIDINPGDYDNDYYLGAGNDLRNKSNPYYIPDEVIKIFEKNGWFWGGNFSICSDTMHFQYLGLEFLTYQGKNPMRELKFTSGTNMTGSDIKNLQQRLNKLGFKVSEDGVYGKTTEIAIKNAQKKYGLKVTGVVDYKTWETLINLTHYMSYVF